jgi:hypothetical protein
MKAVGRYDGNLQMFVEESREIDLARLGFIRWLAENGKLEHRSVGPASGEYAVVRAATDRRHPTANVLVAPAAPSKGRRGSK